MCTGSRIRHAVRLIEDGELVTHVARELGVSRETSYRRSTVVVDVGQQRNLTLHICGGLWQWRPGPCF